MIRSNPLDTGSPLLMAHRGSSILAPENTFEAFNVGVDTKSDVLEIDIRISRDNEVIVIHDESVDRTTDGIGKVFDHKLTQLKKLNAAYRFEHHERSVTYGSKNIKLPTLLELYEAYPTIIVHIDVKDKQLNAARLLIDVIEKAGAEHRTVVGSFHGNILRYFRTIAPSIATSAIFAEVLSLYTRNKLPPSLKIEHRPVALQIPSHYAIFKLDTIAFINKIQAHGLLANYWTINNAEHMRTLLKNGANGIVTDRPDLALEVFQELGFKSL